MKETCVLFADSYTTQPNPISANRTLASIPFGGRYRLIDFVLSSLVNAKISNIGIVTKNNYASLVDHLGGGKDWDLSRKNGGLMILTPFARTNDQSGRIENRISALVSIYEFLSHAPSEEIIICSCNYVTNIDFDSFLEFHRAKNADISIIYKKSASQNPHISVSANADGKITSAKYNSEVSGENNILLGFYIFNKNVLLNLIHHASIDSSDNLERDFILRNIDELNIYGYHHKGYLSQIYSVIDYYKASMDILDEKIRRELFYGETRILTKAKDSAPTLYKPGNHVENSLVADGCIIEGEVINSIIFRGVKVGKGTKIVNSIIMQYTSIDEDASLNCVISDKNVTIGQGRVLSGHETYPLVIMKGSTT